ncbi:hypothetical protein PFISCL1PPCAC_23051, partial [Pristionchus fissidentatus]
MHLGDILDSGSLAPVGLEVNMEDGEFLLEELENLCLLRLDHLALGAHTELLRQMNHSCKERGGHAEFPQLGFDGECELLERALLKFDRLRGDDAGAREIGVLQFTESLNDFVLVRVREHETALALEQLTDLNQSVGVLVVLALAQSNSHNVVLSEEKSRVHLELLPNLDELGGAHVFELVNEHVRILIDGLSQLLHKTNFGLSRLLLDLGKGNILIALGAGHCALLSE